MQKIIIMKKLVLLVTLILTTCMISYGKFTLSVKIVDQLTGRPIPALVTLYYVMADSTLKQSVQRKVADGSVDIYRIPVWKNFRIKVERGLVNVESTGSTSSTKFVGVDDNYEPFWTNFQYTDTTVEYLKLPDIEVPRKLKKTLNEVTVTTKVMFYHKGDTLIYNADAFLLPEGSSLDALLNQMPGVELQSNGRITVNGKAVETLLLNGKDLFNDNRKLMLDNIAAYTVKDIAIYNKRGERSALLGGDAGDTRYAMDVRLKRKYAQGWIVNAEAGYGTEQRYMARLFAMFFSENVAATAYGVANNLSDAGKPSQRDGAWSRDRMGSGVKDNILGGATYNAGGRADKWTLKGNVDVTHDRLTTATTRTSTNYLPTGDNYGYGWSNSYSRTLSVNSAHSFYHKPADALYYMISPEVNYTRRHQSNASLQATLSEEMAGLSRAQVENIYDVPGAAEKLINRSAQTVRSDGHDFRAKMMAGPTIRLGEQGQMTPLLDLSGRIEYTTSSTDMTDHYAIGYRPGTAAGYDRLRRNAVSPDRQLEACGKISFSKFVDYKMLQLPVNYSFTYTETDKASDYYVMDNDESDGGAELLASDRELRPVFSPSESYRRTERDYSHRIGFSPWHAAGIPIGKKHNINLRLNMGVELLHRDFYYTNVARVVKKKDDVLPEGGFNVSIWPQDWKGFGMDLSVRGGKRKVEMMDLVDRPDTDPLNLYLGNPDLKNPGYVTASLNPTYTLRNGTKHSLMLRHTKQYDMVGRAMDYDALTGRRIFTPRNIDGNSRSEATYSLFMRFGAKRQFDMNASLGAIYQNSADFISVFSDEESTGSTRREMKDISVRPEVKINYQPGNLRLTLLGRSAVNRFVSSEAGFTNFTAVNSSYGLSGVLNLPNNWGLSSDITLYTRRGYTDSRLNTTDLVWNARITKSVMKGKVLFIVDAYDILRQLSNISYTVNAQARTETISNVIPAFVLFHVQYRFNRQPKGLQVPRNL